MKVATYKLRGETSEETKPAYTSIFNFQPPELRKYISVA